MSQSPHHKSFTARLRAHKIFGGIKPAVYKADALRSRVMPAPLPGNLVLPLLQHQGQPAMAVVEVGQAVLKYQVLAMGNGPLSVPVHAPTSGVITAIADSAVPGFGAQVQRCIHLQADGLDTAAELQPCLDYRALSHLQLLALIDAAGICGLGGAGFPTAEKLRVSIEQGVELLIINAAECEPYISADESLIRERADRVVSGAEILQSVCLAKRCVIAIEKDKADAIEALSTALQDSSIELLVLNSKFPTGGERQIIQAVTGFEVPRGLLPVDAGILVQNAGTAYAVHNAIVEGKPCISRITTLTGSPLQTPKNFEALIGTPVSFLFEMCGIDKSQHTGTIMGGSLMGIELDSDEVPLIKTTNCLLAKSTGEFPDPAPEQACIRCGYCADVCPARLLPQQLYAFSRSEDLDQLEEHGLADCIECGACAYVCPSHIPLVQYYRASKQAIAERDRQFQTSKQWQSRFQFHQYRLKKETTKALDKKLPGAEKTTANEPAQPFSRDQARDEIAAAVRRVAARHSNRTAPSSAKDKAKDKDRH
ncbi:MAG: electron transport complex subunit RsxC [Proteobacteria bacterium]|nr:electron transport complex subunit RsxC [Pseudomonadota bacterium]